MQTAPSRETAIECRHKRQRYCILFFHNKKYPNAYYITVNAYVPISAACNTITPYTPKNLYVNPLRVGRRPSKDVMRGAPLAIPFKNQANPYTNVVVCPH